MSEWILIIYRVRREPSAARVYVWRRLRRLGALLVDGSVWALPRTPFTLEQAQWLSTEIRDLKGRARVWIGRPFPAGTDDDVARAMRDRSDREFARIATRAAKGSRGEALAREFRDASARDYFRSPHRDRARRALTAAGPAKAARRRKRP